MISNEFTLSKLYPLCKAKDNRNSVHIFDYCDIFHLENKKQQQQLWSASASKKKKKKMKEKLRILHMACLKCVKSDCSSTASKGLIPFTFHSCAFIAHYYQY